MNTISVNQRFTSLGTLGENTDWDSLTAEQVQVCMSSSVEMQRSGAEYTRFVKFGYRAQVVDLFRDTGELSIPIPALSRPTLEELREKFPGIKEDGGIERDDSPIEAGVLKLGTVLLPEEIEDGESITGKKFERRILPKRYALYGYQHGTWFVEHQDESPALKPLLGRVYILLPGLVVVGVGGRRLMFCLNYDGERWYLYWSFLADGVDSNVRVAFSGPDVPVGAGK